MVFFTVRCRSALVKRRKARNRHSAPQHTRTVSSSAQEGPAPAVRTVADRDWGAEGRCAVIVVRVASTAWVRGLSALSEASQEGSSPEGEKAPESATMGPARRAVAVWKVRGWGRHTATSTAREVMANEDSARITMSEASSVGS